MSASEIFGFKLAESLWVRYRCILRIQLSSRKRLLSKMPPGSVVMLESPVMTEANGMFAPRHITDIFPKDVW